jgi:rhodanese-related sulfurtransferase
MKFKLFMISVLMLLTVYGQVLADSCSSSKDASCPDGVCSVTESEKGHDHSGHDHAGHDHHNKKVEKPSETEHSHKAATLNTSALKTLMDSGIPLIILDARSGKWDDGSRIPGAKSLNSESKPEEIAKIIPSKDSLVVTYCSNLKCPASDMLYRHLKSLGYSNVIEYPEGIQGWKEAGNQVKTTK